MWLGDRMGFEDLLPVPEIAQRVDPVLSLADQT